MDAWRGYDAGVADVIHLFIILSSSSSSSSSSI